MSWEANQEKLLCLIVLDDTFAPRLSSRAGQAFFRAFITEDRSTGAVEVKFRFRYKNPDTRQWYRLGTDKRGEEALRFLHEAVKLMMDMSAVACGVQIPSEDIHSFYPPDDGGDPGRTFIWLEMQDLMEITIVAEETEGAEETKPDAKT